MQYYFVSDQNFDNETLHPRIPENRLYGEDEEIERICVSQSVDGCLIATYYCKGDEIYVHKCESNSVISPTIDQVADSYFTGEQWITEPVEMKLFMKIKITNVFSRRIDGNPINCYDYEVITKYY